MEHANVIDLTTDVDQNATLVIRGLMGFSGIGSAAELADVVDIKLGTLYNRLNKGKPWLASELAELARFFDVDPGIFYKDVDTLVPEDLRSRCFSGLRLVHSSAPGQLELDFDHDGQPAELAVVS